MAETIEQKQTDLQAEKALAEQYVRQTMQSGAEASEQKQQTDQVTQKPAQQQ